MAGPVQTNTIKKQQWLSQLEIIFRGPLVKDSMVPTTNDLLSLDTRFGYHHKLVWVVEAESYYYLVNGDGSLLSHWKKYVPNAVIPNYNLAATYQHFDIVMFGNRLYIASQDVPANTIPTSNADYWTPVNSEAVTFRYIFNNAASVVIYTEIRNPMFQVILGELELDTDDNYIIGDDGMTKIVNQEIVEAHIKRREDLANNNGRAYEVSFFEDGEPSPKTGAINVK